ncbi:hypothetical protein CPB83DRAFT_778633, partial [Crepidotus variabilis]
IPGAGWIDGEILETLWAILNQTSRSIRTATLGHRAEILDDHMNDSNWKKMVAIGKARQALTYHPSLQSTHSGQDYSEVQPCC